jgi:hypothetical protein
MLVARKYDGSANRRPRPEPTKANMIRDHVLRMLSIPVKDVEIARGDDSVPRLAANEYRKIGDQAVNRPLQPPSRYRLLSALYY